MILGSKQLSSFLISEIYLQVLTLQTDNDKQW